jgi:SAM-dependent methyltransferase
MGLFQKMTSFIPPGVRDPLSFEVRSFLGRSLSPQRIPLAAGEEHYLNLGAGSSIFPDFINVDTYVIGRRPSSGSGRFIGMDLRYPLRFPDSSIAGIFTEHTLEHLTYSQNESLLRECLRVLKPGGWIRIVVPDLSLFLRAVCASDWNWFAEWERLYFTESEDAERRTRRLITPLTAISFVTQEYGHRSAWDFPTMSRYLAEAGYAAISQRRHGEGSDERLLRDADSPDRLHVSLYVEARKPEPS